MSSHTLLKLNGVRVAVCALCVVFLTACGSHDASAPAATADQVTGQSQTQTQTSPSSSTYGSLFKDEHFASCVADKLEVGVNDQIDQRLLDSMKYLVVDQQCGSKGAGASGGQPSPIASIEGVGRLPNITNLTITQAPGIRSIAPISTLTNLRQLDVSGTSVSDLTPLGNLPIGELRLPATAVDVGPLRKLPNLHSLYVSNPNANISVLHGYQPLTIDRSDSNEAAEGSGLVIEMPAGTSPAMAQKAAGGAVSVHVMKPADQLAPDTPLNQTYDSYE